MLHDTGTVTAAIHAFAVLNKIHKLNVAQFLFVTSVNPEFDLNFARRLNQSRVCGILQSN